MDKVEVYLIPNSNSINVVSYGLEALKINYLDLYKKFVAIGYENGLYKELNYFSKEDNVLILEYYQYGLGTYKTAIMEMVKVAKRISDLGFTDCELVMLEVEDLDNPTFEDVVFANLDKVDFLNVTKKLVTLKGEDI